MYNFLSAIFTQAVKDTTNYTGPIYATLGNKFKVISTKLAKLSIPFAFRATQMVWWHVVHELSILVILGMDWLTQIN